MGLSVRGNLSPMVGSRSVKSGGVRDDGKGYGGFSGLSGDI